jgi:hypothetical protein
VHGLDDDILGDRTNPTWQRAGRDRARGVTGADTGGIAIPTALTVIPLRSAKVEERHNEGA